MSAFNTRLIAIIAVIVILVAGGTGLFLYSKSHNPQVAATSSTTSVSTTPTPQQTLANLLAMGGNKKCTFQTTSSSGGSTSGTLYVSSSNVRGDFVMTTSNGKPENTHIIRIGDENYIWGDSLPTGIKVKLSIQDFSSNSQASQVFNPTMKSDFNCTDSTADSSMFVPPATVKFMDFAAMTAPSSSSAGSTNTANNYQCAACASLTGNDKSTCISAFHCQ